ncbi:monocarboxylate transporter 12-like [Mya arenaria]|uniref:monocarboxylate transporter 12-like n=1 Tax=Mya arenaria TaxID=6604 RepID=UPI0022E8E329|nr:monocarboxylate transporter 12-like [Mya arenaria]
MTEGYFVPDGSWGWVIVGASLIFNIIYDGCSYSFGILYEHFLKDFKKSKSNTAWIGSLFFSMPLLCGPLASVISRKFGYRNSTMFGGLIAFIGFFLGTFSSSVLMLTLSYGLLSGIGMSLPYFNSVVIVANYFNKRRALAIGIAESGSGLGTVIFAPLTYTLISKFGWRGSLLILSGIVANIIVCGALYRPLESIEMTLSITESSDKELSDQIPEGINVIDDKRKVTDSDEKLLEKNIPHENCKNPATTLSRSLNSLVSRQIEKQSQRCGCIHPLLGLFKNVPLLLFSVSIFVMYFWYDVPYVFLVGKSQSVGIQESSAAFLISLIGIVHMGGILLYGCLGDREYVSTSLLYGVSIFVCGIGVAVIPLCKTYVPIAFLAACFGMFSAATEALVSIVVIDIVGLEHFDNAFGVIMLMEGLANLIGPPFAGWLCDISGGYDMTFYAAGFSISVSACIYLLLPLFKKRNNGKENK